MLGSFWQAFFLKDNPLLATLWGPLAGPVVAVISFVSSIDYGRKVSLFLLGTFYAAMVAAGLVIDLAFRALGLIPDERNAKVMEASIELNYTTVLNVIFLVLAAVLV